MGWERKAHNSDPFQKCVFITGSVQLEYMNPPLEERNGVKKKKWFLSLVTKVVCSRASHSLKFQG